MKRTGTPLFDPVVRGEKLSEQFKLVRDHRNYAPARAMLNEVFADFPDPDGNFVEQFQSTGFDARVWELYLFAYFSRTGFAVDRPKRPDFLLRRCDIPLAVEAVTANRTDGAVPAPRGESGLPVPLSAEEVNTRQQDFVPIRLAGPLTAKLKGRYWEEPKAVGMPFVIAVAPFYDEHALEFADSSLSDYLYGVRQAERRDPFNRVYGESRPNATHSLGGKRIESGFFSLPEAENVSAVLFSNAGTIAKFNRMGQQGGHRDEGLTMVRFGTCHDRDPQSAKPGDFTYVVGHPDFVETWGQGISVFHNPRARFVLPQIVFTADVAQTSLLSGQIASTVPRFHPFVSKTLTLDIPEPPGLCSLSRIVYRRGH